MLYKNKSFILGSSSGKCGVSRLHSLSLPLNAAIKPGQKAWNSYLRTLENKQ